MWSYFTSVGETTAHSSPDATGRWTTAGLLVRIAAYGAAFGLAAPLRRHRQAMIFLSRAGIYTGLLRSRRSAPAQDRGAHPAMPGRAVSR
jgi:hypothetical protein